MNKIIAIGKIIYKASFVSVIVHLPKLLYQFLHIKQII